MKKNIKVKSSDGLSFYNVILKESEGTYSLNCNCKAGIHHMLCKHRIEILNGIISNLVDEIDVEIVRDFLNEVGEKRINALFEDLYVIEEKIRRLNKIKKEIKKDIEYKISFGF